jgi:hypothetical protein
LPNLDFVEFFVRIVSAEFSGALAPQLLVGVVFEIVEQTWLDRSTESICDMMLLQNGGLVAKQISLRHFRKLRNIL